MRRLPVLLLCLAAASALAATDPPGRVGRLSLAEGAVSVFVDPGQGWEDARLNTSLTGENSVWTEPGARAEVRIGAIALRLGETTQLDLVRLDDEALHAHVPRGSVAVRLREFDPGATALFTTAGARFLLLSGGRYRIDANPDTGESRLSVFSGSARLEAAAGTLNVDTGRSVVVANGRRERFEFVPAELVALDEWARDRDLRDERREAARYVAPEVTGWEDLDDYGTWRSDPAYGPVWYPAVVAAGWAPFRYGHWTWVRPWGWTWVDDAPWGYAPSHYGRWVYLGGRWGWSPGRYHRRPVWAPALVGWVGTPGWSVTISGGPVGVVGWYPLSPYEAYQPWYVTNPVYVTRINQVVIVHRGDRRGHRDADHRAPRGEHRDRGATVVPRDHFGSHRPVQNVIAPVGRDAITTQPIVSGTAVLPSREEARGRSGAREPSRLPGSATLVPGRPDATPAVPRPAPAVPAPSYRLVKPVTPSSPEPATPAAKPVAPPVPPAAKPVPPPSYPLAKPVPAYTPPVAKPVPAPAYPLAKPVPTPAQPEAKPVPAPTYPLAKPVPAPAQPEAKPVPAPAYPLAKPVPAPAQPEAKPVPSSRQPVAKPVPEADPPETSPPAKPGRGAKP